MDANDKLMKALRDGNDRALHDLAYPMFRIVVRESDEGGSLVFEHWRFDAPDKAERLSFVLMAFDKAREMFAAGETIMNAVR